MAPAKADTTKKGDAKAQALKTAKAVKTGSTFKKKAKKIRTKVTFHRPRTLKTVLTINCLRLHLHSSEKGGIYNTKWTTYCVVHRTPTDNGIVIRTSSEVFCAKGLLEKQNQKQSFRGSRLLLCTNMENSDLATTPEKDVFKPLSAARCHVYRRSNTKNNVKDALFHWLVGPIQHSVEAIDCLTSSSVISLLNTSYLGAVSFFF